MAEGHGVGQGSLWDYAALSRSREIWTHFADASSRRVDPIKYCRVASPTHDKRVHSIHLPRRGSVAELEMQMMLAADLGYCIQGQVKQVEEAVRLISDLRNMLNALRRTLSRSDA